MELCSNKFNKENASEKKLKPSLIIPLLLYYEYYQEPVKRKFRDRWNFAISGQSYCAICENEPAQFLRLFPRHARILRNITCLILTHPSYHT